MLFFFGTGSKHVTTVPLAGVACPHCGKTDSSVVTVFSRYFHFFWIPAFPIGKTTVSVCQHCKQALRLNEMPPALQAPARAAESSARTPLTSYALLLLAGAGILFIAVVGGLNSAKSTTPAAQTDAPESGASTTARPAAPATYEQEGRRYRLDEPATGPGPRLYRLVEVNQVIADSVFYRMTQPLHKSSYNDSISIALNDSVPASQAKLGLGKVEWQQATAPNGIFRRLPQ